MVRKKEKGVCIHSSALEVIHFFGVIVLLKISMNTKNVYK